MKVLVIPEEAPMHTVEIEAGDGKTLKALQGLVGGFIEALPFPEREDVTCYINEEGKFECLRNPAATKIMAPVIGPLDFIAGPLVVCGFDLSEGETLSIPDDLLAQLEGGSA